MSERRLVAVLPCRCDSTRLWGKPLQQIATGVTLVEHLATTLRCVACVQEVVLAIANGPGRDALAALATRAGLAHAFGSEDDVLGRVITCAREARASDVLRKTSEDPFVHFAALQPAWERHVGAGNDVTALDLVPEGTAFEIFTLDSLRRCHERSSPASREHIADYARFHQDEFRVEVLTPDPDCRRLDLRLTVDNPEDLILCRAVHRALARDGAPIALPEIIGFLDGHPDLTELVSPFVHAHPTWLELESADAAA